MAAVDINEHEMVGAGRCRVRAGLEQLFEVGFQAAISLAEYL
jgi:hypothetical protein